MRYIILIITLIINFNFNLKGQKNITLAHLKEIILDTYSENKNHINTYRKFSDEISFSRKDTISGIGFSLNNYKKKITNSKIFYELNYDTTNTIKLIVYNDLLRNIRCKFIVLSLPDCDNTLLLVPITENVKKPRDPFISGVIIYQKYDNNYYIGFNKALNIGKSDKSEYFINDIFRLDNNLNPLVGYRFYNDMLTTYSVYNYDGYEISENFFLLKQNDLYKAIGLSLSSLSKINRDNIEFYFYGFVDIKSSLHYPFWFRYPYYNFK